jgi:hypothetical protein
VGRADFYSRNIISLFGGFWDGIFPDKAGKKIEIYVINLIAVK